MAVLMVAKMVVAKVALRVFLMAVWKEHQLVV
jgi:hypothetical protein